MTSSSNNNHGGFLSPTSFLNSTPSLSVRARRALFESSLGNRRGNVPHVALERSLGDRSGADDVDLHNKLPIRRPLGFLSPNFIKQKNRSIVTKKAVQPSPVLNTSDDPGDSSVSLLQKEISALQSHLETLEIGDLAYQSEAPHLQLDDSSRREVFDFTLSPKEFKHVKELNHKLHEIQTGLLDIEGERQVLVARAQQLEEEKYQLVKHLRLREQEIETLQKRCSLTVEQSKQLVDIVNENHQLVNDLETIKTQRDIGNDEHVVEIMELKVQLQRLEIARRELEQRLEIVQRDYDGVCSSLDQCMTSVDRLSCETKEWEAEQLRILQDHELELEQQRIAHMQATKELREELKAREKKVLDLERLLQEKIVSIARLRQQLSTLEASQTDTIKQVSTEHECKIHLNEIERDRLVAHEVENKLQDIVNECREQEISFAHDEMTLLQFKLTEKCAEIETLRNDVSKHMMELMITTGELQKLQEDSVMLDGLFQDVETLEHERYHLTEKLHERDIEIAEMSAEILKFEIERELTAHVSPDIQSLTAKLEAATKENESSVQRLCEVEAAYQSLSEQIRTINTGNDATVSRIRLDYDTAICNMQQKLQRAEAISHSESLIHSEAMTAKDKAIANLMEQMAVIKADYQIEISTLQNEMERAVSELATKDSELINASESVATIHSLQAELTRLSNESLELEMNAAAHIAQLEADVRRWHAHAMDIENNATVATLEQESVIRNLTQTAFDLRQQNEALQLKFLEKQNLLNESESNCRRAAVLAELNIDKLEDKIRQLQATVADFEHRALVQTNEHQKKAETLARTISELECSSESSRHSAADREVMLKQSRELLNQQQLAFDAELSLFEQQIRRLTEEKTSLEKDMITRSQESTEAIMTLKQSLLQLQLDNESLRTTISDQKILLEAEARKTTNIQLAADEKAASLSIQLSVLQSLHHGLENEIDTKSQAFQPVIDRLTLSVTDVKRERDLFQMTVTNLTRKVEEITAQFAVLSKQKSDLEQSEYALQRICKLLRFTAEAANNDRDQLALEQEISRQELSQASSLKKELGSLERKTVENEEQLRALEEALHERTNLLADMVKHNKELQTKIDRGDVDFHSMEEHSSSLQVRLLDKEEELRRLKVQWQQKEDEYLGAIHGEQNLREVSESDLVAANMRLELLKSESRDLLELEKENQSLKDKIRRQEAYLQRKIDQEKAARDRSIAGSALKAQLSTPKAPSRAGKGSTRTSSPEMATKATKSTVAELDIDLDSLLAD